MRFKVVKDRSNSNYAVTKYRIVIKDADLEQAKKVIKVLEE